MQLTLSPLQVICGRHGEPFKPRWPVGYEAFTSLAMQALLVQDGFQEELERYALDQGIGGTVEAFDKILHVKPLCCRLKPDTLLAVYQEINRGASVWQVRACNLCGKHAPGCEYRKAPPNATSAAPAGTWRHVCLGCIAKPRL